MSVAGAALLLWEYGFDVRDTVKFRLGKGLASSQAVRNTKVAHSSSPGDEPRVGSDRRYGSGFFDNANVDVVPAIVNSSSWDNVGVDWDADEREGKNQREESGHRGHFPAELASSMREIGLCRRVL